MQNTFRIKTDIGQDKVVNFQLDQNIEFLEILSFKIRQSDVYTLDCANYGVVAGRITANNGFGIPNARVSIFIPLSEEDEDNELITSIYPYKTISDKNEDGYRYNLLPYEPSYPGHIATGTFPTMEDVMFDGQAIEVYEKYYKYTVKTNSSGDYMIFGIPVGSYTILMDLDLSDIGEFSLTPQDLIRMGRATEAQFKGNSFQKSSDLESLPQIVSLSKGITISPLWGDPETCDSTINRVDFDLRADASIDIQPTAIFIGSIFGTSNIDSIRINCGVKESMGNLCQLETGPGQILAIRQTRNLDSKGLPILEEYELDNNGRVIDGDGTWVVELPMNLEYVVTDENGNQIITNDEKIGIPRKGKYRFKVKWQDVDNSTDTSRKAHFLVPNIKEYGWGASGTNDPINSTNANIKKELAGSYYFGLDWDGYTNKDAAIRCEDTFYEFEYNKVYTVAGLVDQYQGGTSQGKFIGIKEISDRSCEQNVNKYPVNDAVKNFDLLYFLFSIVIQLIQFINIPLIFGYHLVSFLWNFFAQILLPAILGIVSFLLAKEIVDFIKWLTTAGYSLATFNPASPLFSAFLFGMLIKDLAGIVVLTTLNIFLIRNFKKIIRRKIKKIHLPNITYPNCELCDCEIEEVDVDLEGLNQNNGLLSQLSNYSLYYDNFSQNFNWANLKDIIIDKTNNKAYKDDTLYEDDKPLMIFALTQAISGRATNSTGIDSKKIGETDIKMPRSDKYMLPILSKNFSVYSETLPVGERINYFNLRNSYFSGKNKIKVSFANDLNRGTYHYDNVIVVLSDVLIETGELLSFVNSSLSKDVNFKYTGTTTNGEIFFGKPGSIKITEQNKNIIVRYATTQDKDETKTYTLPVLTGLTDTSYYASDLEYFQVLTGMTYYEYLNISDKTKIGYFPSVITSPAVLRVKLGNQDVVGEELIINNPLDYFQNIENQYVLIIQRGVDPYSPEYTNKYGLGKIFGYDNEDQVSLTINTKLNIPIQKLNDFNNGSIYNNNLTIQTLTDQNDILFDSYTFQPGQTYSTYKTDAVSYYAGILNNKTPIKNPFVFILGLRPYKEKILKNWTKAHPFVVDDNFFIQNGRRANSFLSTKYKRETPTSQLDSKYNLSRLDFNGGSYMNGMGNVKEKNQYEGESTSLIFLVGIIDSILGLFRQQNLMLYFSYSSHLELKDNPLSYTNKNKIVLRTDRLPTSDGLDGKNWVNNSVGVLQQNNAFRIYRYPKLSKGEGLPAEANPLFDASIGGYDISGLPNASDVLNTFNLCGNLVPYSCYSNNGGKITISDDCTSSKYQKIYIKDGCYQLVRRPILDLIPDINAFREWMFRFKLNYGICRGVISESFVNNWVNGSLFMFSFRANINKTNPEYCKDLIYYDASTNNFYYRSSPYDDANFVGNNNNTNSSKLNNYNLMYPTTIVNLGIKNRQQVSFNDFSSYGYVMNSLNTTSHYDNSDLVNFFVISRILDSNVLKGLILDNKIIDSFFSRAGKKVDGDLAQLLSINSEFGVVKFSPELYEFKTNNSPTIIFSEKSVNGKNKNHIGVFYSSSQADLQLKDYITPGRVNIRDINSNALVKLEKYGNKSQEVPFYSWTLYKGSKTIFGTEENNWGTSQKDIKKEKYQSLERIKFTTTDLETNYFSDSSYDLSYNNDRGYIFAQKNNLYNLNDRTIDSFIVGAPFHFYFGIKKGFSALDKFKTKYLNE
jgi:hypothetical protein